MKVPHLDQFGDGRHDLRLVPMTDDVHDCSEVLSQSLTHFCIDLYYNKFCMKIRSLNHYEVTEICHDVLYKCGNI